MGQVSNIALNCVSTAIVFNIPSGTTFLNYQFDKASDDSILKING